MRNVMIADDHAVTRRGIREVLVESYPGLQVLELADGAAVLASVSARPWDLILLDVMMPGPDILDVIAGIRAASDKVPVLVLTASNEISYVVETMKAGANGLIHKHHAAGELLHAVECVAGGGTYLHADAAIAVAKSLQAPKAGHAPHHLLSERELEIFRLIAVGRAVKEIAFELGLSDKTVATYLARIRTKTGLADRVDIARYALQQGLVE